MDRFAQVQIIGAADLHPVFGGVEFPVDIAAAVGDQVGGLLDAVFQIAGRLLDLLVGALLVIDDRIRDVGPQAADLDFVVALQQHVGLDAHHFGGGVDAQRLKLHGHGVAQVALFQQGQILVLIGARQIDKGHRDGHGGHPDVVGLDVLLRPGLELRGRGLFLKILRKIDCFNVCKIITARRVHDRRVAHDKNAVTVRPVRVDTRPHIGNIAVLLNVGQILAVADGHAPVGAPVIVQLYCQAVPFVFATINIQNTAGIAAKPGTQSRRGCHGKIGGRCLVRPKFERVFGGGIGFETRQRGRHVLRRKDVDRDAAQVVGDVPRIDRANAVHWFRDAVDSERLRGTPGGRDRCYNAAVGNISKMHAGLRVLHFELELAVALLHDGAGDRIGQRAQTLRCKARCVCWKKYRGHSVHHLGVQVTAVMPPDHVIAVSPCGRLGNRPFTRVTTLFLLTVPL